MLQKLSFIGSGACGNQIARLAKEEKDIDTIAVNSTKLDTTELEGTMKIVYLGNKGCGKLRNNGKDLVKQNVEKYSESLIESEEISTSPIVVVGGSAGGGTGAGSVPITSDILRSLTDKLVIALSVLPDNGEDIRSLSNAIETCKEIESLKLPYMLIDNGKCSGSIKDKFNLVNRAIVDDLSVIRGDYNANTQYGNMDVRDCERLFSTPGLLTINKIAGLKETTFDNKSFDDLILDSIKSSYNVQLEKDKIIKRMGVILSVTEDMLKKFDRELPKVKEEIGTPVETFLHVNVVENTDACGIITILAGLSFPDTRLEEMAEIVEKAKEALLKKKESTIGDLSKSVSWLDEDEPKVEQKKDLGSLMSKW